MPTRSSYPDIDIPQKDIWSFLFERDDRPYPDAKGNFKYLLTLLNANILESYIVIRRQEGLIPTLKSRIQPSPSAQVSKPSGTGRRMMS